MEKGGRYPVHHALTEALHAYIDAAEWLKTEEDPENRTKAKVESAPG
jgi:hypothetical protein